MIPLTYFISSSLIILAVFLTLKRRTAVSAISLIAGSLLYSAFCLVAYGKMSGFISTESVQAIIRQKGFNPSVLPISVETIMHGGFLLGIILNIATSVWIYLRKGFWGWCLLMTGIFCLAGIISGPLAGVSPVISLFGLCCGAMAGTGWVVGLSYIDICVIGNIWIPCLGIMAASAYLIFGCVNGMRRHPATALAGIIFGMLEIAGMAALLWHYHGPMNDAFYTCVRDLKMIAAMFGTTYAIVNLIIYVLGSVMLMVIDIAGGKHIRR